MYSKTELKMLSDIGRGHDTVPSLIASMGTTRAQVYKILSSLRKKEILHTKKGKVILERKTHVALLMRTLRNSMMSYVPLSGNGMDILTELTEPRTVKELSESLNIHQTTVSEKIRQLSSLSMIWKEGTKYYVNLKLWPDLPELIHAYRSYHRNNDPRAAPGSMIHHVSKDLVVFSNDSELENTKTAFSRYPEFGMDVGGVTEYYCDLEQVSLKDVFLHSLHVISDDKDWWLRMMALIFYVKYKDELKDTEHKMKDEMDVVLTGVRVKGWVPLSEMNERAVMYGVRL
jgi:predicted transcriptional regulator